MGAVIGPNKNRFFECIDFVGLSKAKMILKWTAGPFMSNGAIRKLGEQFSELIKEVIY
jgi:hypothetical protein